jgi:hypothetical protein
VLQNRTSTLNAINENTLITNKIIDQFTVYYLEALQLKDMKGINEIPELHDQIKLYNSKIPYFG